MVNKNIIRMILFPSIIIILSTISFLLTNKTLDILLVSVLFSYQGIIYAIKQFSMLKPFIISIMTYTVIILLYTNNLELNNILICLVSYTIGYFITKPVISFYKEFYYK